MDALLTRLSAVLMAFAEIMIHILLHITQLMHGQQHKDQHHGLHQRQDHGLHIGHTILHHIGNQVI